MVTGLPQEFLPVTPRQLELRPGHYVDILHGAPLFKKWCGVNPPFSFGGKLFLEYGNRPLFAELLILELLKREGWEGVWVSSFGGKFLADMPTSWKLENAIAPPNICGRIPRVDGRLRGCFDVVAWRGEQMVFCESKRKHRDKIRESQKRWIDCAIQNGLQHNLLVVEWDTND